MSQHVVMYSGGLGSWATALMVQRHHMAEGDELVLLFSDTLMEDPDLYRFLDEGAAHLGVPVTRIADGRDPWQVFFDKRYLGNTRIDPCSYYLKRKILREWLEANAAPASTTVYLGIDWTEAHRFTKAAKYWAPWDVQAPLIDLKLGRDEQLALLVEHGVAMPRLYELGFAHNNCGGFCIKAGQGHFKKLLADLPERYDYHARREQELREYLGKDVAILRDRAGGTTKPLTLVALRERVLAGAPVDDLDIGGCNCLNPDDAIDREIEA